MTQSAVVVRLEPGRARQGFTAGERQEIEAWIPTARRHGFDRLVVHARLRSDPPELTEFLAIYPTSKSWARWCLARRDDAIQAWRCDTGSDVGRFGTLRSALLALLPSVPELSTATLLVHPAAQGRFPTHAKARQDAARTQWGRRRKPGAGALPGRIVPEPT